MALQGTIDAFPIADVLQLLAGSRKTGRLIVEGDRSTAQLFVVDGALSDGSIRDTTTSDLADVIVELLRYGAGSFLFEPGSLSPNASTTEDLAAVIETASERLAAWAEIEAHVPSLAHRLHLVGELASDEVLISAGDWPLIVAAGWRSEVGDVVAASADPQIETCSRIVGLLQRGLVTVEGPKAELVPVEPVVPPRVEPTPTAEPDEVPDATGDGASFEVVLIDEDPDEEVFPEHFPIDDLVGADEEEDPWVQLEVAAREERLAASQSFDGASEDTGSATEPFRTSFDGSGAFTEIPSGGPGADLAADSAADEVLRQMSKLSPKAAEAIAAALGSAGEPITEDTVF